MWFVSGVLFSPAVSGHHPGHCQPRPSNRFLGQRAEFVLVQCLAAIPRLLSPAYGYSQWELPQQIPISIGPARFWSMWFGDSSMALNMDRFWARAGDLKGMGTLPTRGVQFVATSANKLLTSGRACGICLDSCLAGVNIIACILYNF